MSRVSSKRFMESLPPEVLTADILRHSGEEPLSEGTTSMLWIYVPQPCPVHASTQGMWCP